MSTLYSAHATMRNGTTRQVRVTAADQIEARRRMFALSRATISITTPRVSDSLATAHPRIEHMRRAGDEVMS